MLRIQVGPAVVPYAVVDGLGFTAPEIWAIGLSNPWRFSFDGEQIWIGDVGQGDIEEIDLASAGIAGQLRVADLRRHRLFRRAV